MSTSPGFPEEPPPSTTAEPRAPGDLSIRPAEYSSARLVDDRLETRRPGGRQVLRGRVCVQCDDVIDGGDNEQQQQGGETQQYFCGPQCINQYKMRIFCEETEEFMRVSNNEETQSPACSSKFPVIQHNEPITITPELWSQSDNTNISINNNLEHRKDAQDENDSDPLLPKERSALEVQPHHHDRNITDHQFKMPVKRKTRITDREKIRQIRLRDRLDAALTKTRGPPPRVTAKYSNDSMPASDGGHNISQVPTSAMADSRSEACGNTAATAGSPEDTLQSSALDTAAEHTRYNFGDMPLDFTNFLRPNSSMPDFSKMIPIDVVNRLLMEKCGTPMTNILKNLSASSDVVFVPTPLIIPVPVPVHVPYPVVGESHSPMDHNGSSTNMEESSGKDLDSGQRNSPGKTPQPIEIVPQIQIKRETTPENEGSPDSVKSSKNPDAPCEAAENYIHTAMYNSRRRLILDAPPPSQKSVAPYSKRGRHTYKHI